MKLPVLSEQRRTTSVLERTDGLHRKRKETLRLASELLQAIFINFFGDPETNPKRFARGTIRDLVSSANYGSAVKANEDSGRFAILRMNNITYEGGWDMTSLKYVDLDERTQEKYLARKGDLLFNRTNSKELVGKTAVYDLEEPIAIAGYLIRVRVNELGDPHYVSGYLNSKHGKRALLGRAKSIVGMANINAQELQDIPILLPPPELQKTYAKVVRATNNRIKKLHTSLNQIDSLKAALASELLIAS